MKNLHDWNLPIDAAKRVQTELAGRVIRRNDFGEILTVAGADIALDAACPQHLGAHKIGIAGVIVYEYPSLKEIERVSATKPLTFPYVPGLLAFREGPALMAAFEKLKQLPDLIFFDGQGIAHPRRLGIASHLGLWLDRPTIGCAKSLLVGKFQVPAPAAGSESDVIDKNEVIGKVLRTRANVRPIFVSLGHRIDLPTALRFTLSCLDGRRIPKPTREADKFVARLKR